ncbi:MAG: tetratricopeptide repeat protein [Deltaproteobacteria bacterium]|nr:tetratricopeptide repeat protein [Deltaproteobacteria bacterium]
MTFPNELSRRQSLIAAGSLALLAFAAYFNALANGLVWDDPIVLGRQLRVFGSLASVFFPPHDIPQFSPDYYRPITTLSYLIDQALGGNGPLPFHLSVVLYHVVATVLVFRFGTIVFAGTAAAPLAALIGAALFAVHPIHSESVALGAGRSDVIACALALAGAGVYCGDRQRRLSRAALAAGLILLGALAKETALAVLLLAPAGELFLTTTAATKVAPASRAERRRQTTTAVPVSPSALRFAPFAVAVVVYGVLRHAALESMVGGVEPLTLDALVNVIGAVGFYLFKVILPVHQSAYVSDLPIHPLQLLLCTAVLAALGVAFRTAWRRRPPIAYPLLWTMFTLAPSLAIVLKIPSAPVAERYLYIPSVGACLLCGFGCATALLATPVGARRNALVAGTGLLVVVGMIATIRRNAVWRSNISLWEDTAEKNTTDGLPLRSLAAARLESGAPDAAAQLFNEALQRRNNAIGQQTIYNNLGSLAMQRKQYDEAERDYRKAIEFNRTADGLYNLGLIPLTRAMSADASKSDEWKQDQARQARDLILQAANLNPHDADTQVAIGQAAQVAGNDDEARSHFQQALEMGLPESTAEAVRKRLAGLH